MSLEKKLNKLLNQSTYVPLTRVQLEDELNISGKRTDELKVLLGHLVKEGTVTRVKKNCYVLTKDADLISGTIRFKTNGSALLIADVPGNSPKPEPLTIPAEYSDVAMHGDHVLVRILDEGSRQHNRRIPKPASGEIFAEVKRILKRRHPVISGTLKKSRSVHFVIPDDPRIIYDIILSKIPKFARIDEKVLVELDAWTNRHESPQGKIIQSLGPTHAPQAEYEALLHKYELSPDFPQEVTKEAAKIPTQVRPKDIEGRLDCRDLFTITIDPDDAKDFDDAISLEKLNRGSYRVGIHIADVSAYVSPNSALDKEAQKRGNSTYLVDSVVPMLPYALSNGICSLVEGQNRLTKTVFLTFNNPNKITKVDFANCVICSNKRLTYNQAFAFLKKSNLKEISRTLLHPSHQTGSIGRALSDLSNNELKQIKSTIEQLWIFASSLKEKRMKRGSLDLDMPEIKIFVDKKSKADRIERIEYDESHQLIEEFMLAANQAVAKRLFDSRFSFISRVHDKPNAEKLSELRETLLTYNVSTGDLTKRKSVVDLLKKIKTHPQGYTLKIHLLRSIKQACYRAQNDVHYGLHMTFYTHFTSPIRRYSDLIVHRIFDHWLTNQQYPTARTNITRIYKKSELTSLSQHLNITEQNSTEAERESVKIKLLEFYENETKRAVKNVFDAIITYVRNHGMFIEVLNSQAFGFIHTSTLKDDLYKLNYDKTAMIGKRRGRVFKIGQTIKVSVKRVDRFKRQIDFLLADKDLDIPGYSKRKRNSGCSPRASKKREKDGSGPKLTKKKP